MLGDFLIKERAQYLFDLAVSLNGNSPMKKQREWTVAVFPTPVSGVGCHFIKMILFLFFAFLSFSLFIIFFLSYFSSFFSLSLHLFYLFYLQ